MNKAEWSLNIDEFEIGQIVTDEDGSKCRITNKTTNSIEVFISAKNKKGIDVTQWFEMRTFIKRFK